MWKLKVILRSGNVIESCVTGPEALDELRQGLERARAPWWNWRRKHTTWKIVDNTNCERVPVHIVFRLDDVVIAAITPCQ